MPRRDGSKPGTDSRDQLDTIRVDSDVLGRLRSLSRIDEDVDSLLAEPTIEARESRPRQPQVSVPFELNRPPAIPLTDVRPPQMSIPFELSKESLVVPRPREAELETKWESVPPEPRSRLKLWLAFFVLSAVLAAELVMSGLWARALHAILRHRG